MIDRQLKKFLKNQKIRQVDLAEVTGVHHRSVQNYCTGVRVPDGEFLGKLIDMYRLNINWLLRDVGEMYIPQPEKNDQNAQDLKPDSEILASIDNLPEDERDRLSAMLDSLIQHIENSKKKKTE